MLSFLSIRIGVSSVPKNIKDNALSYILSKRQQPLMTLEENPLRVNSYVSEGA